MISFLEHTASYLVTRYGRELSDLCIVMPNRRAGLFLRKHLAKNLNKTIWSPAICSIEDFVASISGLQLLEPIHGLAELYEVHKELEGEKAQPFEEFMSWAPQLLSDFNDVDRYLVDARQLFEYLDEAKAIALWNPDLKPLTDFEKQYLRFYNSLYSYYQNLMSRLLNKKQATQGLLFRMAAEGIEQSAKELPWGKIVFAGFSAMTRAEEFIIHHLYRNGKADLLWDGDSYYLKDEEQEAGGFLRHWFRKWNIREPKWIFDDFLEGNKNIQVIGVANNVGQAKVCGEILSDLGKAGKLNERSAVVLPDGRLLLPLLNSLPDEVRDLNITMGLPLRYTPLAGLIESIFTLHLNVERFRKGKNGKNEKYYFRDVMNVLEHPYMKQTAQAIMKENYFAFEELVSSLKNGNRIFLSKEDVVGPGKDLFSAGFIFMEALFDSWTTPSGALHCLQKIIETIRDACLQPQDHETTGSFRLELEYLFVFSTIIRQLGLLIGTYDMVKTNATLFLLFRQLAESTSLPFYGEPLKGIQVMGMLETRVLDFDNLILLSCNEDLLPGSRQTHSFIPFDVRREFQMPTYRQSDSVYAYHFYRLLQRSQQTWLIYNTESGDLGGGEKSRFLKQIIHELPSYSPRISIQEHILNVPAGIDQAFPAISVPKTSDVMQRLEERAQRGFSPTSLNAFRKCPLSFYFSEIAGISEPEKAEETIDPKILGQAVHLALKNLYQPLLNQTLSPAGLSMVKPEINGALDAAFIKVFSGPDIRYGKNLLLVGVARNMIHRFLASELDFLEELAVRGESLTIVDLERYLEISLEVEQEGKSRIVRLKGIIDRLDLMGGELRIIDYKTGTVEPKQMAIGEWRDLLSKPDLGKAFQLLVYTFLLHSKNQLQRFPVRAGIISLKKIGNGFMGVKVPEIHEEEGGEGVGEKSLELFEVILKTLICSIFDSRQEFSQTADRKTCLYCPYINLCGR